MAKINKLTPEILRKIVRQEKSKIISESKQAKLKEDKKLAAAIKLFKQIHMKEKKALNEANELKRAKEIIKRKLKGRLR